MTAVDITEGTQALAAAREADEQLWTMQTRSARYRQVRGRAIVTALGAGMTLDQVADVLRVRPSDVDRTARRASSGSTSRSIEDPIDAQT
jgi:hypothetical protein